MSGPAPAEFLALLHNASTATAAVDGSHEDTSSLPDFSVLHYAEDGDVNESSVNEELSGHWDCASRGQLELAGQDQNDIDELRVDHFEALQSAAGIAQILQEGNDAILFRCPTEAQKPVDAAMEANRVATLADYVIGSTNDDAQLAQQVCDVQRVQAPALNTNCARKRRGRPPGRPNMRVREEDYQDNAAVQAWNSGRASQPTSAVAINIRHALGESLLVHETQRQIFRLPSVEIIYFVQGWITARHIASQRPSYVNGLLIHSRGQDAPHACAMCVERMSKNALGPFLTCRVLPGSYHNSCSNCKWFDTTSTCSLYTGPKPNRKRKPKNVANIEEVLGDGNQARLESGAGSRKKAKDAAAAAVGPSQACPERLFGQIAPARFGPGAGDPAVGKIHDNCTRNAEIHGPGGVEWEGEGEGADHGLLVPDRGPVYPGPRAHIPHGAQHDQGSRHLNTVQQSSPLSNAPLAAPMSLDSLPQHQQDDFSFPELPDQHIVDPHFTNGMGADAEAVMAQIASEILPEYRSTDGLELMHVQD